MTILLYRDDIPVTPPPISDQDLRQLDLARAASMAHPWEYDNRAAEVDPDEDDFPEGDDFEDDGPDEGPRVDTLTPSRRYL